MELLENILLLLCITTSWAQPQLYVVTPSDTQGPYGKQPAGCEPPPAIDNADQHQVIVDTLNRSHVTSAWLPIKKDVLPNWQWLNGKTYKPKAIEEHVSSEKECGQLRIADSTIEYIYCNHKNEHYICEENIKSSSNCSSEANNCFEHGNKTYFLYSQQSTWYDAIENCLSRGQALASLDAVDTKLVTSEFGAKLQSRDAWIGLGKQRYFVDLENQTRHIQKYFWGPRICPCPVTHCVIITKASSGSYGWLDEDCSNSHHFLCRGKELDISLYFNPPIVEIPAGDETTTEVPYNATTEVVIVPVSASIIPILLPILISLIIIIVLIILLLYCILKKRKISKRKEAEGPTNNLELGSMMRNQPHNIPSDTEPEEVPVLTGTTPSVNGVAPNQTGSPINLDSKDNGEGNSPSCKEQKPPHDDSSVAPHRSFPEPDTGVNEEEPSETEPLLQRRAPEADQHPPRDTAMDDSLPKSEDFPDFGPMPVTGASRPAHPTDSQKPRGPSKPSTPPENLAPETKPKEISVISFVPALNRMNGVLGFNSADKKRPYSDQDKIGDNGSDNLVHKPTELQSNTLVIPPRNYEGNYPQSPASRLSTINVG